MLRFLTPLLLGASLFAELHEADRYDFDQAAAKAYCASLGSSWRLLGIKELFTLRGDRRFSQEESFWSSGTAYDGISRISTGSEGDAGQQRGAQIGYTLFLRDGDVTLAPLSKKTGVICTDAPPVETSPRYEQGPIGVKDFQNDILWADLDTHDKKTKRTFEEAQRFCEDLNLHGRSWRLPSLEELYGIVTYDRFSPSVDTGTFGVMMSRYYWSDDTFGEHEAYVVGFKLGSVATSTKSNHSYFRCVSDLDE